MTATVTKEELTRRGAEFALCFNGICYSANDRAVPADRFLQRGKRRLREIIAGFAALAFEHRELGQWSRVCEYCAAMTVELSGSVFLDYGVESARMTALSLLIELDGVVVTFMSAKVHARLDECIQDGNADKLARLLKKYVRPSSSFVGCVAWTIQRLAEYFRRRF